MGLKAAAVKGAVNKEDRVEQPIIDPGNYPARLVQIIDMGLQPQRPYQGQDKPPANEIMLTYELVDTFCVDKEGKEMEDKPRWISETIPLYSIENDRAKSTQRYFALDPQGVDAGDFSLQIGKPVNVTLVHNKNGEKIYVNVASISSMRPRDADKCPELVNPPKIFDLDNPDLEILGSLPQWVQEKIKGNLHFNGSRLQKLLSGEDAKVPEKEEAPKGEKNEEDLPW